MKLESETHRFGYRDSVKYKRALYADILELTTFPNAPHDDQVDSTVHALEWDTDQLNSSFNKAMEWVRLETMRGTGGANSRDVKMFRVRILKAGQFQLRTRTLDVSVGDVIEVSEEELGAFLRTMSADVIPD